MEFLGTGKARRGDLDRAHDRDVGGAQDVDRLGLELGIVALHDHRLAGLLGEGGQLERGLVLRLGERCAVANLIAAEIAHDQQRIDGRICQNRLAASRHVARVRIGAAAGIDRVVQLRGVGRDLLEARFGLGRQDRQVEAALGQCIDGLRDRAAAFRQDGDAAGWTAGGARDHVGDREHLVGAFDQDGAGLAQSRTRDGVVAGQRARMRAGRALALVGTAGLVEDDRLARGDVAQSFEEGRAVLEALDIDDDRAGVGIVAIEAEIFVEADIAFVADAHEGGEAGMAVLVALRQQGDGDVARLAERAQLAGIDAGPADQVAAGIGVEDAGGVRTDHAHGTFAGCLHAAGFERRAVRPGFAEATGQHQGRAHTALAAQADHVGQGGGRRADQGEIDLARRRGEVRVAGEAQDFAFLGIDRQDAALVAVAQQRLDRAVSALHGIARGADDCDRARLQEVHRGGHGLWLRSWSW